MCIDVVYVAMGESVDHLLLHCPASSDSWPLFLSLFGLQWVMPAIVIDLMRCWNSQVFKSSLGIVWRMVPFCVMWQVWLERMVPFCVCALRGHSEFYCCY